MKKVYCSYCSDHTCPAWGRFERGGSRCYKAPTISGNVLAGIFLFCSGVFAVVMLMRAV